MTASRTRARFGAGLTVWEILVIVLIIGTLAAIAVPIMLGQSRPAKDDVTVADALDLSVMIRAEFEIGNSVESVTTHEGWHSINGEPFLEASPGVEVVRFIGDSATSWCIELWHPHGDLAQTQGVHVTAAADEAIFGACSPPSNIDEDRAYASQ